jgi:hypothetical protein
MTDPLPAPQPAPTEPSVPEAKAPEAKAPTLDDLLAQFDAETRPVEQPAQSKPQNGSQPAQQEKAPQAEVMAEFDRALGAIGMTSELRNHLQNYATTVHLLKAQHEHQQTQADFEKIVSKFDKEARERGYPISEDYTRRWLIAEAQLNPHVAEAFDRRYESPDNQRRAERMVKKAQERFLAAARKEPDPDATTIKADVAWAMRGATSKAPPEKAPRYGDMTDSEFRAELKKHGLG